MDNEISIGLIWWAMAMGGTGGPGTLDRTPIINGEELYGWVKLRNLSSWVRRLVLVLIRQCLKWCLMIMVEFPRLQTPTLQTPDSRLPGPDSRPFPFHFKLNQNSLYAGLSPPYVYCIGRNWNPSCQSCACTYHSHWGAPGPWPWPMTNYTIQLWALRTPSPEVQSTTASHWPVFPLLMSLRVAWILARGQVRHPLWFLDHGDLVT